MRLSSCLIPFSVRSLLAITLIFCGNTQDALNLGEVLRGTRIYETPYKFKMGEESSCRILCRAVYDTAELQVKHVANCQVSCKLWVD